MESACSERNFPIEIFAFHLHSLKPDGFLMSMVNNQGYRITVPCSFHYLSGFGGVLTEMNPRGSTWLVTINSLQTDWEVSI